MKSFKENLLKQDCSEDESSGSESDSGSGNEGGGTGEGFTRSTSMSDLLLSHADVSESEPFSGFFGGESRDFSVGLLGSLLGLPPPGTVGVVGVIGGTVGSASGGGGGGDDVAGGGVGDTPLGSGDFSSGNEGTDFVVSQLDPGGLHSVQGGAGAGGGVSSRSEADMVASGMEEAATFGVGNGLLEAGVLTSDDSDLVTIGVGEDRGGDLLDGGGSPGGADVTGEGNFDGVRAGSASVSDGRLPFGLGGSGKSNDIDHDVILSCLIL